jgi:hypothetical protein
VRIRFENLFLALALLGEQHRVDVRQNTSLGNGDSSEQTVELLVVTDGQLNVAGDDARALVSTAARYTGAPAPTRSE